MSTIIMDGTEHEVGNIDCPECWGNNFPKVCECGGLIHEQYFDENWDDYIMIYKCDKCGSTDEPD